MSHPTIPISLHESSIDYRPAVSDLCGGDSQSVQHDNTKVKHPHNERIMEPIPSNQQSLATFENDDLFATPHLPPVVRNMSCYARRSRSRFKPYQLGDHIPTALEHRFTEKYLRKHDEADLSFIDVKKGKEIFKRGMMRMPDETVYHAVVAKKADVECKRLRALSTAWELESTERHAMLLQHILKNSTADYIDSMAEASFFERLLVKRSRQQLEDDADFVIAAYTRDFTAFDIAEAQLGQLQEISAGRKLQLSTEDISDADDPDDPDDLSTEEEELIEEQMSEEEAVKKQPLESVALKKGPPSEEVTEDGCSASLGEYFRDWQGYYSAATAA
ncbi:hypothetical protein C8R48DRAFT_677182 [Suillus tomentosus]|nr:hypothetical protein C8R48DRAFT_677182 [Suillus tomentosus]